MGLTLVDDESKRWGVEMADKTARTIEARGFRVEHGALIFNQPAGCVAQASWRIPNPMVRAHVTA
jgi:hypothetical protein